MTGLLRAAALEGEEDRQWDEHELHPVCRDCPSWRDYRCVECDYGGPVHALYRSSDGALRCFRCRAAFEAVAPGQIGLAL